MKRYKIFVTQTAKNDIDELFSFIVSEYKSLSTAEKYINGIEITINKLTISAESLHIQNKLSTPPNASCLRRINYKKMAIFYTVNSGIVYIHRVIPAARLTEL